MSGQEVLCMIGVRWTEKEQSLIMGLDFQTLSKAIGLGQESHSCPRPIDRCLVDRERAGSGGV